MKYLLVLLVCFSVHAEQEFNISYSHIDQDLEFANRIEFDMKAVSVSYSYFSDWGLGAEIVVSRSTETPNTIVLDTKYTNKINALWSASVVYKQKINDDHFVKYGAGITEYHSTWKVDGEEPSWSKGTDSHKPSYFVAYQYRMYENVFFETSYRFMYEKQKEDKGREITSAANFGVTVLF